MALTTTEAQAVNDLLRFVAGLTGLADQPVDENRARNAAEHLAGKAHNALGAGLGSFDVTSEVWPRLTGRLAACDSDGAAQAVCRAIEAHRFRGGSVVPSIGAPFAAWVDARKLEDHL